MVWIVASVFYAYQYILRVMPNIMLDDIMQKFQFTAASFGQFSGVYYIGYALMHIPMGIMLDRFGPRKVMTASILLSVVGALPLLFATHWVYPVAGRLLIGIGSSCAILGLFKVIRMAFSEERFSRMLSISVMIGLLGAIYGGAPVSIFLERFGYDAVVQAFIWTGVALAVTSYCLIPDMQTVSTRPVFSDVIEVLQNRRVIATCLFAGAMVGPLEGFADVWATVFLKDAYHLQGQIAASLPSMIFVGMCFGAPLLSFIAEKSKSYLATIVGAGALMTVAFVMLLTGAMSATIIAISFVAVGVASSYQILAIYVASTYVREEVAGVTTALSNMIIMLFGYGFHTVIGYVVAMTGNLVYGIGVIPVALFIGTVGFFTMERKNVCVISE